MSSSGLPVRPMAAAAVRGGDPVSDQKIDESGRMVRGTAPVSAVSVPSQVGIGDTLVHSLDYVVLLHLLFASAGQRSLTPPQLWEELKARGIRSAKNANELVGRNAVYESLSRLIEAGFVRRVELANERFPGRKGRIVYEVFDNPAWNPDWQARQAGSDPLSAAGAAEKKPQVGTLPGTPEASFGEVGKTAGQNASRNAGSVNNGSGVPGSIKRRVPAGQNASGVPGSIEPSPPHPPEEVDTSSPYPLTDTQSSLPSQREEEAGSAFTDEQLAEAAVWLGQLPAPWTVGRKNAREMAPELLEVIADQGWSLDDALAAELTKNPHNMHSPARVLRKDRIPNLVRREMTLRKGPCAAAGAPSRPLPHQDTDYRPIDLSAGDDRSEETKALLARVRRADI